MAQEEHLTEEQSLTDGRDEQDTKDANDPLLEQVIDYVRRYGRVKPRDVAEEFDLGGVRTLNLLTALEEMGALRLVSGGDGVFAVPTGQSLCDPVTGTCSI